ncbi:MAG TPA: hypothetical protein VF244_05475 [Acidimicrobiales bacterium]
MTARRTSPWASLGLAALLALTACAGGDDDEATDSTSPGGVVTTVADGAAGGSTALAVPDPCALVTVEEVSAAFGSPIDPPEGSDLAPPIGGRTCLFINSDAPPIKTLQIVTRTDASIADNLRANGQTVEKLFQDTKNLTEGTEDVGGLGDQAYKTARAYHVLDGGVYLETNLGLNANPSAEAVAALQTLTEKAVARL